MQVVEYADVQFTKAPEILRGMGLELEKSESALTELRDKGLTLTHLSEHDLADLLVLLAAGTAMLVLVPKLRIPYPILLVLGGLLLGFAPGLPRSTCRRTSCSWAFCRHSCTAPRSSPR